MKRTVISWLLLVLFGYTGHAQYTQSAKDSAQSEITQLSNEWNNAIVNRDSLVLDKILGPEYSLNGSVSRTVWMNNTLHHIITDTLKIVSPLNIAFYGQAVKCEGTYFWKAAFDGKPRINAEYLVTDIWIKRNGQWQVILRLSRPSKTANSKV
jgi:hypothetical protein